VAALPSQSTSSPSSWFTTPKSRENIVEKISAIATLDVM
jgi:hypothetical protein